MDTEVSMLLDNNLGTNMVLTREAFGECRRSMSLGLCWISRSELIRQASAPRLARLVYHGYRIEWRKLRTVRFRKGFESSLLYLWRNKLIGFVAVYITVNITAHAFTASFGQSRDR